MNYKKNADSPPVIGMLAWEGYGADSLSQLEVIPGNILHPETFKYPIELVRIDGANYRTVVEEPSAEVLAKMKNAARDMEKSGIRAITTSCGFNVIFQQELKNAVDIPVFTSSLLQVPMVYHMLNQKQQIGIITADKKHLKREHLEQAGILESFPVSIVGMEKTEEFSKIRHDPEATVDTQKFIQEIVDIAKSLVNENKKVGAIVLECTDLPPASAAIRRALGLPVFDIVTLVNMVYESVIGLGWENHRGL